MDECFANLADLALYLLVRSLFGVVPFFSSEKPNPDKDTNNKGEESEPNPPADARFFGHSQHSFHRPFKSSSRAFELIVHLLCQSCTVPNLASYRNRNVF